MSPIVSVAILGRQPALGMAELENLYGAHVVSPIGRHAARLNVDAAVVPFGRLGGSVKIGRLLTELNTTRWQDIERYLHESIPQHLQHVPEGKFTLGLSVYGMQISTAKVHATSLDLKKTIRSLGRSVRIVPNKAAILNAAQVLHNQLTSPNGWELLIINDGDKTLLAQTYAVQDIDDYTRRDRLRPKRDAKVGMLPPKLAQILVNLAVSHNVNQVNPDQPEERRKVLLDPFCGTGVVMQEALLMGYDVIGTDLDPRMVHYSDTNLEWLRAKYMFPGEFNVRVGDAASQTWPPIDMLACETWLGPPLSRVPLPDRLRSIVHECNDVHRRFLQNLSHQIKTGFRVVLAVPAWQVKSGQYRHLPLLDYLAELGYTRVSFVHAPNTELVYAREDQIVARELVILQRN